MININNLSVFYDSQKEIVKALGHISFEVESEEICVIIGPSGCGKTTLLNVLAGIVKNFEGEVFLYSEKLNPHIHNISYIPQNFGLLPWKTVEENCFLPLKIKKEKIDNEVIKKMDSMMERLNIEGLKKDIRKNLVVDKNKEYL